ncbi:MAG: hypothetical protein FJ144_26880 [Deltaproteobacteria bacterium]|nr:hypothetical protein [Deltaproteobacteria bacterium]
MRRFTARTLTRRELLESMAAGVAASAAWGTLGGCGRSGSGSAQPVVDDVDPRASLYGRWEVQDGLPVFAYTADHETLPEAEWDPVLRPRTRRQWHMLGNRALQLQAANDGTVALFDEQYGLRWLTAPDPSGTGISLVHEEGGRVWSSDFARRAGESVPVRLFGPTHFEVRDSADGLALRRTILCPEGEVPWVLVRVELRLDRAAREERSFRHVEQWAVRPRFLSFLQTAEARRAIAIRAVSYGLEPIDDGWIASERFSEPESFEMFGPPARLRFECLPDSTLAPSEEPSQDGELHPTLEIAHDLVLSPGDQATLYFRFGRDDGEWSGEAERIFAESRRSLGARLPRAGAGRAPEAEQEIPWHAAVLTGGASRDGVVGGHTLDQASAYSFEMGFNGAARDPLQHALPLVYAEPDLALSVLRNTCAWATPEGDLPYALDGAKRPLTAGFRPSDANLWALWLAAEYAAATGDLAAFDEPLEYHPLRATTAVPLREHLRRQLRFFVDVVGRGARDHVRILNADWNDLAIEESGADRDRMIESGSSVLNSAMAAWVMRTFAGLADRLGEGALATEARAQADELRTLVRGAWNGRWFHRAYGPDGEPIGDSDCWLEVQPWAILCGAASGSEARSLLATIDAGHRAANPIGTRLRWPAPQDQVEAGLWGTGTRGGSWFAIDMTLVWAAASIDPDLAWDAWRRMTLGAHTAAYPDVWEGTLSGPDSWNAPEYERPGRTWVLPPFLAMQMFPVANLHAHAQPLLAYLRLLGVEPTADGALRVGGGEGRFASRTFEIDERGRGRVEAIGSMMLETPRGRVRVGPGTSRF